MSTNQLRIANDVDKTFDEIMAALVLQKRIAVIISFSII